MTNLQALDQICIDPEMLLSIKRNHLVPLLDDQMRLNHFADQIVQAQAVLLQGINPQLNQQFSQLIAEIVAQLNASEKVLKHRRFNRLQRWMGSDLEHASSQLFYMQQLQQLIEQATQLAEKIRLEVQKSRAKYQQASGFREHMVHYIRAANEFLQEYPQIAKTRTPMAHFSERLQKKVHTLQTLQASNDLALAQMLLNQQLSLDLLDRFDEAKQVLIPAWQFHLQQRNQQFSTHHQQDLDQSREKLIHSLQHSLSQDQG